MLAAGIGDFRGAEFRGFANDSAALDFDQLVDQIQVRRITRRRERGADAERVNRGVFREQRGDARLVEIARRENLHVLPSDAIQLAAHPLAVFREVAAIEPHAGRLAIHR